MRERAQSMGSQLKLESELGLGTRIMVKVPMERTAADHADLKTNTYSGG